MEHKNFLEGSQSSPAGNTGEVPSAQGQLVSQCPQQAPEKLNPPNVVEEDEALETLIEKTSSFC